MTILGAIADRHGAIVWADSALTKYGSGAPSGEVCKLAINSLAGAIGVGRGWDRLIAAADRALLEVVSADDAPMAVCTALRRGAARLAPRMEQVARYSFAGCGYVIVAWSASAGRPLLWDLDALSNFEPALTPQATAPLVEWPEITPPTPAAVRSLAAGQAAVLAEQGLRVGRLTIATMDWHGITALPPFEIAPVPDAGRGAPPAPGAGSAGAGEAQPLILALEPTCSS